MRILFLAFVVLVLTACGGRDAPETADESSASTQFEMTVKDAFIMVPLEGRDVTMGGATIEVSGQAARLTAVEADFADVTELHTMTMEGGMMQMRQVEGYDVMPGSPLALQRGGDHLMFFGLSEIESGSEYPVRMTLELADGTTAEAEVVAIARALGE
ncbi:MAG: copper chaperone PCu(A)C [Pseudomonadota bacterium]